MTEICIWGLFGHFDYKLDIKDEKITILTGPNGFGKSTIIRCIHAVAHSDLGFFFGLVFERIEITKDNLLKLVISWGKDSIIFNNKSISRKYIKFLLHGTRPLQDINLSERKKLNEERNVYKNILEEMKSVFSDAFLVTEHRVVKVENKRMARRMDNGQLERVLIETETIEEIPKKLNECIKQAEKRYLDKANELDSTFPERLFRQKSGISKEEFQQKLEIMHNHIQRLNASGLLGIRELKITEFSSEDSRALKVYFDDFDSKYQEYKEILSKIELFTAIVNQRFMFKKMEISNTENRIVIQDSSGNVIKLSDLSSGEKETIALFYTLLFEAEDDTILLIDEPEMSLHIAWQRMFMDDLKKVTELKNMTVLIATHSPQIINGNRNLQIDLGELYKNGLNKGK